MVMLTTKMTDRSRYECSRYMSVLFYVLSQHLVPISARARYFVAPNHSATHRYCLDSPQERDQLVHRPHLPFTAKTFSPRTKENRSENNAYEAGRCKDTRAVAARRSQAGEPHVECNHLPPASPLRHLASPKAI